MPVVSSEASIHPSMQEKREQWGTERRRDVREVSKRYVGGARSLRMGTGRIVQSTLSSLPDAPRASVC